MDDTLYEMLEVNYHDKHPDIDDPSHKREWIHSEYDSWVFISKSEISMVQTEIAKMGNQLETLQTYITALEYELEQHGGSTIDFVATKS